MSHSKLLLYFEFYDSDSFRTKQSEELARLLGSAGYKTTQQIFKDFGISINMDVNPPRLAHDGRKVGIGSFHCSEGTVNFVIFPKNEGIFLKNMSSSITEKVIQSNLKVHTSNASKLNVTKSEVDFDFSPSILLILLDEILEAGKQLSVHTNLKQKLVSSTKIKGTVKAKDSYITTKKNGIIKIVSEKKHTDENEPYARLLKATATMIVDSLADWNLFGFETTKHKKSSINFIFNKFIISSTTCDWHLMAKLCRPPHPFGMKNLLHQIEKFWRWREKFKISNGVGLRFNYKSMTINLDVIFQEYVKVAIESSMTSLISYPNKEFKYSISSINGEVETRKIVPDHLIFDPNKKLLLVSDAKYSNKFGSRDHVFQITNYLTYANYGSHGIDAKNVVGLLLYPGTDYQIFWIKDFLKPIALITIPARKIIEKDKIAALINSVLSAA